MGIAFVMVCSYIGATVLISAVIAIKNRAKNASSTQFLTAENGLKWYLLAPLMFAEMMAGAATIGKAATGFTSGIVAVWVNWGMAIGIILFIIFVARFYRAMHRKFKALSVPEAFGCVFDRKTRMVVLIIIVVTYCYLYSSQPISAAAILCPMLGIQDPTLIAWTVSGIFIIVTLLGGMKGLAILNVVHMVVMYSGLIWLAQGSLEMAGGFTTLTNTLPGSYFDFLGGTPQQTMANAAATALSYLACAPLVAATISAKSAGDMTKGSWISALLIIPFAVLPALVGMCAVVVMPDIVANDALYSMAGAMGEIPAGYVSMAVMAAVWSSAPAALLFVANTLTQDFYGVFKKNVTNHQKNIFSKSMIVVFGIIATFLGLNASSILGQLYAGFQIRSVVAIILLGVIFWKRTTTEGAFWSAVCGGIVACGWNLFGNPFGLEALWPATLITIFVLVVVSLRSKEKVSQSHKICTEAVQEMLEEERLEKLQRKEKRKQINAA
ncbi:MAG: sodium:solute symporter family protein [Clostridia bacterium]